MEVVKLDQNSPRQREKEGRGEKEEKGDEDEDEDRDNESFTSPVSPAPGSPLPPPLRTQPEAGEVITDSLRHISKGGQRPRTDTRGSL